MTSAVLSRRRDDARDMCSVALVVLAGLRSKRVERVDGARQIRMYEIDTGIDYRNADAKAIRAAGRTANSSDASGNDLCRSTAAASRLAFSVLECEDRTIRNNGTHERIVHQRGQGIRIRHSDCRSVDAAEVHAERGAGPAQHRSPVCGTGAFMELHDVILGNLGECDTTQSPASPGEPLRWDATPTCPATRNA